MVSFQCSPLATAEGIVGTFKQCARLQKDKDLDKFVAVVVLDEVGLAEDSPQMPLKVGQLNCCCMYNQSYKVFYCMRLCESSNRLLGVCDNHSFCHSYARTYRHITFLAHYYKTTNALLLKHVDKTIGNTESDIVHKNVSMYFTACDVFYGMCRPLCESSNRLIWVCDLVGVGKGVTIIM